MKKIFLFIIGMYIVISLSKSDNTKMVFNETNSPYSNFIINFQNNNISTNNIDNYFYDIKIVWIEPYINNLYKEKFKGYTKYEFDYISNKKNIEKFINAYNKKLEIYGFKQDILKYKIDGIKIKRMMIYCSLNELNTLKQKIDGLTVE